MQKPERAGDEVPSAELQGQSAAARPAGGPSVPSAELQGQPARQSQDSPSAPEANYKEKAENYYDQLLRLQAEFANFRKRAEKERHDSVRYGKEHMVERMISLLDVMESAVGHARNAADLPALKQGFEMVVSEFSRFLKAEGAEAVPSVGQAFDPHLHEAVEQVETDDDSQSGKVVEEVQKGYRIHGRLLRPARVKVARKKPPAPEAPPPEEKNEA